MLIPDSTVWVDYFNGVESPHTRWLDREVGRRMIGVTDLILCEVLQGIRDERQFRQVQREISAFTLFSTVGEEIAVAAANNYRSLRKLGLTVRKTVDCIIATFCLVEDHMLLHHDRDFDAFEKHLGLKVLHPSEMIQ